MTILIASAVWEEQLCPFLYRAADVLQLRRDTAIHATRILGSSFSVIMVQLFFKVFVTLDAIVSL